MSATETPPRTQTQNQTHAPQDAGAEAPVPAPAPAGTKKELSKARMEANARNAQFSTGPRTIEGKNICKYNNLRHGGRADTLVLPGESAEELSDRMNVWASEWNPQTEAELYEL